jgi:hypothetical protein
MKPHSETKVVPEGEKEGWRRIWPGISAALCLAFSVLWTWPAAWSSELVGRQSDTLTTIWFLDAAARLPADPLSNLGEPYHRLDSYLLWLLALLLPGDPGALHRALQVGGIALTAWATERTAAALGARTPWSLLAGFGFVGCGLASSALLEGYVYPLINPWLPLLVWALYQPRSRHGLVAAMALLLALASNGYLGACALLLVGAIGLFQWRTAAITLLASAPGLYFYLHKLGEAPTPGPAGPSTSANLLALSYPTAALDQVDHSLLAVHPWTLLALSLTAPVVLRRQRWQPLAFAAGVALLLSTGPSLALHGSRLLFEWPWAGLYGLDSLRFLRFPVRLGWVSVLCTTLLGAWVAGELARRSRSVWTVAPLWLCLGVDLFCGIQQPFRQREQWATVPSIYRPPGQDGDLLSLDLLPEVTDERNDLGRHFRALICYYQTGHRQPIPERCLGVEPGASPREQAAAQLLDRLLKGQDIPTEWVIGDSYSGGLPVDRLVWHPDLFRPGDRERLRLALEKIDPAPTSSRDGGEFLIAYRLPGRH